MADFLNVESQKLDTDEHGTTLTPEYIDYAVRDTQTTWESYEALRARYEQFGLTNTPVHQIYSEASLGKAYLREMGIKPWREVQPEFPPKLIGQIMSTYYGGRAEVHIRRTVAQVLYCDFLSMYPTVCTLMGLWRFVVADGIDWRDNTEEVRAALDRCDLRELQRPETW